MRRVLLLIGLFFLFITPIYAAQSSITEAEGSACMGKDTSRKQTEQAALLEAKRRAAEFVSTHIKSETQVNNFEIEKDLISAYANAEVKIIQELTKFWYKDAVSNDCYKIKIKAEIIPGTKSMETKYNDYDLQERCGKRAEQMFKDKYSMFRSAQPGSDQDNYLILYMNHKFMARFIVLEGHFCTENYPFKELRLIGDWLLTPPPAPPPAGDI